MAGGLASLSSSSTPSNQTFIGQSRILGPKWLHLPTLTIGLLGVQIFWSVEMGYASPYLLSLGLTKSSVAIVFLAGPLSGLIVQPVIGVITDTTTSRFGRRRPWMMAGTVITVLAMMLLGYTRAFASIFTGWDNPSNDRLTVGLAVLAIYLVDFSINAVMAVDRALIVDTLPPEKQAAANAWAARMHAIGSMTGFFVGSLHLTEMFSFFGKTQLEILSTLVSVLVLAGHILTCICVREKVLVKEQRASTSLVNNPVVREFREMWSTMKLLPSTIRQIFAVQFFAAMAWFPMMFYGTLYIAEVYKHGRPVSSQATAAEIAAHDAEGARLGNRAMFYAASLNLTFTLILPFFVIGASKSLTFIPEKMKISLPKLWAIGNLGACFCMWATSLSNSLFWTSAIFGISGIAMAIGAWAPYALLGEAILESHDSSPDENMNMSEARAGGEEQEGLLQSEERTIEDEEKHIPSEKTTAHLSGKAGIILGFHNVFIVIPQFMISGISAVVFAIFDSAPAQGSQSGSEHHTNSLKYVYRLGGIAAFISCVLSWRLSKHLQKVA